MVSTRTSDSFTCVSDPEFERTFLRRLRDSIHSIVLDSAMGDGQPQQTLRELMNPDLTQQPLAVTVPALDNGCNP